MIQDWDPTQNRWGATTFAQHGEDLLLMNLFDLMDVPRPSYLDIGAHHPFNISNTALLYRNGSRGINVEPNPNLFPLFKRHRGEDINLNVGVGPVAGRMRFYMVDPTSGLNSFRKEEIERIGQTVTREIDVDVITISDVLLKCGCREWPDLLLTDAEDMDVDILQTADFSKSKPKVVVSEIRPWQSQRARSLMVANGYFLHSRVQSNLVFVDCAYTEKVY